MSDFRTVRGFEEVWRPPVRPRPRRPEQVLASHGAIETRARLQRLVRRAPEVMVKVTGRTRDAGHLSAHLRYITRHGALAAEGRDGWALSGRGEVDDLAQAWAAEARQDRGRRANSPLSVSVLLSMPPGTDPARLRDAAQAFVRRACDGFDYVLALHTDTSHPHVHLAVNARGDDGRRLNPRKADLQAWRQTFAECLRERGIDAEATPRRTRGVSRKAERGVIRRIRERHEQGQGPMGRVAAEKWRHAAKVAFGAAPKATVWEQRMAARHTLVRELYLRQAELLAASPDPADRELARAVERFVSGMDPPDSERLALARRLRALNARERNARDIPAAPKDRA